MSDVYEQRSYAQVPIGFGAKPGIVVVDYQVGFTDPSFALGGAPLILRGVNILGIDSVMCPHELRNEAWARLAKDLPMDKLDAMTEVVPFAELPAKGEAILKGQVRGRCVVDVNA